MRRMLVVVVTVIGLMAGPSGVHAQQPASKPDKGFAFHPMDTRGQGNMGVPCMRDPYGHDKDRSRLETGNQGRPVDCAPGQ